METFTCSSLLRKRFINFAANHEDKNNGPQQSEHHHFRMQ
jgi:hypothetical protein